MKKQVVFTGSDYNKMKKQPAAFRADGGSSAWRIASDECFDEKEIALSNINSRLSEVEIKEVKALLAN